MSIWKYLLVTFSEGTSARFISCTWFVSSDPIKVWLGRLVLTSPIDSVTFKFFSVEETMTHRKSSKYKRTEAFKMACGLYSATVIIEFLTRRFPIVARPEAFKMVACSPSSSNFPTAVSFPGGHHFVQFQNWFCKTDVSLLLVGQQDTTCNNQKKLILKVNSTYARGAMKMVGPPVVVPFSRVFPK